LINKTPGIGMGRNNSTHCTRCSFTQFKL